MRWVYDGRIRKWVVLIDDVVIRGFDTEGECIEYIRVNS